MYCWTEELLRGCRVVETCHPLDHDSKHVSSPRTIEKLHTLRKKLARDGREFGREGV